jgi:hypothetical protein
VIVFEIFRRNGDCTFYVAVKIGGDSKKMMGLAAISFDKAFRLRPFLENIFLKKCLEKNNFLEKFSRNSRNNNQNSNQVILYFWYFDY